MAKLSMYDQRSTQANNISLGGRGRPRWHFPMLPFLIGIRIKVQRSIYTPIELFCGRLYSHRFGDSIHH